MRERHAYGVILSPQAKDLGLSEHSHGEPRCFTAFSMTLASNRSCLQAPALPLRPVVEDHPAAALITLAYDDTRAAVMHDIGVATIQRGGDVLGTIVA